MATGLATFMDGYNTFMETKSDPRTKDWMLMSGPVPLLTILITYFYFCTTAGPRWMKDRKPFDLKYVLMVYNAFQVAFSIWLVHEGLQAGWLRDYSYRCQPVDYSDNPLALRVRHRTMYKMQNLVVHACSHQLLYTHCHMQYRLFPLSE